MKFLCDAMLGKLARWLRIMGYDTELATTEADADLVERADREDRVLLTRDKYVNGVHVPEGLVDQLVFLALNFGLEIPIEPVPTRCPVCNGELVRTSEGLPDGVSSGWVCTSCGKKYWAGSHWVRMKKFLLRVRNRVENLESS